MKSKIFTDIWYKNQCYKQDLNEVLEEIRAEFDQSLFKQNLNWSKT